MTHEPSLFSVERGASGNSAAAPKPEPPPTHASEGRWLIEGVAGYIRIPTFADPGYEQSARELVRRFRAARCLIVDVRDNGGGATPFQLIRALMNRPWKTWQAETPQRIALYVAQRGLASRFEAADRLAMPSREVAADADAFPGRVVLLVDRYTGSAAEDFVMPFKTTGRATIVGETTQGSSGQPFRLDLGHGMSLLVGAQRYRFPDGSAFEGVGIQPDVPVERRITDIRTDQDAVLLKAAELARSEAVGRGDRS